MPVELLTWEYRIAFGRSAPGRVLMIDWVDGESESMSLTMALTQWGEEGWELVSACVLGMAPGQELSLQYILKRQKGVTQH